MLFEKKELPKVDKNGFFQTFHDITIGNKVIDAGGFLKVLEVGKYFWLVRPKHHKDSTAVKVKIKDLRRR